MVEMFKLDEQSRKPIYEQLSERFKELIVTKVLEIDEQMPSVRELSREMKINPNTIQKSYQELKNQGYLYSIKGKAYYVSPIKLILKEEKIQKEIKPRFVRILQEAIFLGLTKEELVQWFEEIEKS